MGACVSTHQKSSAMKVQVLFGSSNNDIAKPPNPIINGDLAAKTQWASSEPAANFHNFGSKEEIFFDSQAWLDSDCDDDFLSVNGEFTPSRGNTPVHHKFSPGIPQTNSNKPPGSPYQPSPKSPEKKMRLSELFKDRERGNYDSEGEEDGEPANKKGLNLKVEESPLVSETMSLHHGEMAASGGNGLKTKRERLSKSVKGCFPSLLSSRSSSMNGRKMMSPGPGLSPSPIPNIVVK